MTRKILLLSAVFCLLALHICSASHQVGVCTRRQSGSTIVYRSTATYWRATTYYSCGFWGFWSRCSRSYWVSRSVLVSQQVTVYSTASYCCAGYGGTPPNCRPICQPPCQNGGTCTRPGYCSCANGWTGYRCEDALCQNPVNTDNGMVNFTGNSVGDTAMYTCDSGFELIGSATTTCTLVNRFTAEFQPTPPSCRPVCTPSCNNGGNCTVPDTCVCTPCWTGPTCDEVALPRAGIFPPGTLTAGELFSLTCTVTVAEGDSLSGVQWKGPNGTIISGRVIQQNSTLTDDCFTTYTSTLKLVKTSHGGKYNCRVRSTAGNSLDSKTLFVQIPLPTLTVSHDPDANTTLRNGDDLTLTCTIQLDEAVDSDVVVTGILRGPTGRNSTIVKTLDSPVQSSPVHSSSVQPKVYQIVLYIPSLLATSSETCTCTASVDPGSGLDFVQSSESHTDSIDITVELLVSITVSYTPPPGFISGPNEYRAASGPVNVTCTAVGGTGPVSYQWSSTCRDCPFQNSTSGSVYQAAVHSGDTGTHTCTATRGSIHGSSSFSFNVVGAGIHVFRGTLFGSLPNNGLAIALLNNEFRLRLFCRSDSMLDNVGLLIGPNGTTVTTGDVFDISHPQPGELRVENRLLSNNALTANDQGVYTCCIPLRSGEKRNINVGIYASEFITPPSIVHLGFTYGHVSSNLTCISTGSPATTVTWMWDGQPLYHDGTYKLMQTVTDRRLATYSNILIIKVAASDIFGHTYSCTVINVLGTDSEERMSFPPPTITISPYEIPTAGELFSLTCTVTLAEGDHLIGDSESTVQWTGSDGVPMNSTLQVMNNVYISTLEFSPVRTSHGGKYICQATSTASAIIMDSTKFTVQIPPPTLTVSRDPDASTTLRHGDSLSLTCTIQLEEAVDSDVVVTGRLQGQAGRSSTVVTSSDNVYKIMLNIPSLRATPFEICTCTASVDPGSGVDFVQSSEPHTDSLNITVELLVDVRVSNTPPPGFISGPNEYRAASGPVIVTCIAVGGTGPVSYQWSSTCRDCPFQTATSRSVHITVVHSGDTGTHTCTATRGSIRGSRSISFNVVGAGIHVFRGIFIRSLPNNGLAISHSSSISRLCLFCRSDSMLHNVGMLIGLNGTTVTSGDVFDISHPQPGELRVENKPPRNALTANDQGVYTCRIPLQSGEERNINVGIYIIGFIIAPSITHLGFTHGPISSNLTCISTGSPATTVTWMRDGQQLSLDDTYKLIQTITDRRQSTYKNVLIMKAAASDIFGHTYSCTIRNTLGTISEALTAFPPPTITISPYETPTVGKLFSLTCTVTLAEGDHLIGDSESTVQWMGSDGVPMNSTLQMMNNVYISTLEFNPVRTSHGGEYICQATSTAGTIMDDTKFTPVECIPECEHGVCVAHNICLCDHGWLGQTCSHAVCFPDCHRGDCIKPDECSCHPGYGGPKCALPMCHPECLNGGTCVLPALGLCACPVGFFGSRCEILFSF